MRFRTGLIVGLAAGYYYGTRAGRERHEQIQDWIERARTTTTVQEARTKLSDAVREGSTAARRLVDESSAFGRDPAPSVETTGDPSLN